MIGRPETCLKTFSLADGTDGRDRSKTVALLHCCIGCAGSFQKDDEKKIRNRNVGGLETTYKRSASIVHYDEGRFR